MGVSIKIPERTRSFLKVRWEKMSLLERWPALNPYMPFLVFTVLGLLLLGGLGLPSFQRLPALQQRLSENQQKLGRLKVKNVRLAELLNQQEILKTDLSLVDKAVPDEERVPELLAQIEKIASESGVSLRSLHFGLGSLSSSSQKNVGNESLGRVYLQSEAEGPYTNLQTFLEALEKAIRIVDVDSLRFTQETVRDTIRLRATLGLVSFFAGKDQDFGADKPINLNLGGEKLLKVMEILRKMQVYNIEVVGGEVGRPNPFE